MTRQERSYYDIEGLTENILFKEFIFFLVILIINFLHLIQRLKL